MKLIVEMEMPKDCPMCPMAHYNKLDEFTGCEVAAGKLFAATRDKAYAESTFRPDWCPICGVLPEKHGDLIDRDALIEDINKQVRLLEAFGIEDLILIGKELQKGMIAEINKQTPVIAAERKDDGKTAD